jgi:hypothetical protein
MSYDMLSTIARLNRTTPSWDHEVLRAVGTARALAIVTLIQGLGADIEYADLEGIEMSQARPVLPELPLNATNAAVRDLPGVKQRFEQEGHAVAQVSVDIESQGMVMAAVDLTFEVGR